MRLLRIHLRVGWLGANTVAHLKQVSRLRTVHDRILCFDQEPGQKDQRRFDPCMLFESTCE